MPGKLFKVAKWLAKTTYTTVTQFAEDVGQLVKEQANIFWQGNNEDLSAMVVALIAYWPDKEASQQETRRGLLEMKSMLGDGFDPRQMEEKVNVHIKDLQSNGATARTRIMRELAQVDDPDTAAFLVGIGIAVAKADGEPGEDPFSPEEKTEVREIAQMMGLDHGQFGL